MVFGHSLKKFIVSVEAVLYKLCSLCAWRLCVLDGDHQPCGKQRTQGIIDQSACP